MNTGFLGPAVATVLTACGIETYKPFWNCFRKHFVATVLTACGIETGWSTANFLTFFNSVATVLTACGIETHKMADLCFQYHSCNSNYRLRY